MGGSALTYTTRASASPDASSHVVESVARDHVAATAAFAGVVLLLVVAPFERTQPLIRLPGQSLSNLEAAVATAFVAWLGAIVWSRRMPIWRTPLTWPWVAFVATMLVAALGAPLERVNALHMSGRFAAAFAIYLLAVNGVTTRDRLVAAIWLMLATGVTISVLAVLEYLGAPMVLRWLKEFRPQVMTVGALVRAGGPLQYPTIASMYLEIVFACGVGLMLLAADASRRGLVFAIVVALSIIAYAIALTFTRAGVATLAASIAVVAFTRIRARGWEIGGRLIAGLAVIVVTVLLASRSTDSIWLRLTTEGQESWYRAGVEAPAELSFGTGSLQRVPVALTNTGRVVWDSQDDSPFLLSYHWMELDGDRYITFEGLRTPFDSPVAPGESVTVRAAVRAPRHPGVYRLEWDVVQERRLWFNAEPGAQPVRSRATVEGPLIEGQLYTLPPIRPAVRPGRLVLWGAAARMLRDHPILGIGPDNFRLTYASYAGLRRNDTRVHSNNMYIEVLVGGGIVAALVFFNLAGRAAGVCVDALRRSGTRGTVAMGVVAACLAIAVHGCVDSFLSFAPTYILFSLTVGLAAASARGVETGAHAHRV